MAAQVEALVGFDTYPHVDCYERGLEAIKLMHAQVEGRIRLTQAYRQLPLLTAPPAQCTMHGPMLRVLEKLRDIESRPQVATATVSMGFPFADIRDAGVSVLVATDGERDKAEAYADELAAFIWAMRRDFDRELVTIEEAIDRRCNHRAPELISVMRRFAPSQQRIDAQNRPQKSRQKNLRRFNIKRKLCPAQHSSTFIWSPSVPLR